MKKVVVVGEIKVMEGKKKGEDGGKGNRSRH